MPSGFHQLLVRLDADPAGAASQFELLRGKLVRYLRSRGAAFAEDEADEALHRVAAKLASGMPVADVENFAYAVARLVRQEARRGSRLLVPLDEQASAGIAAADPAEDEMRAARLQRSLEALPGESRALLLAYFAEGRGAQKIEARRRLARQRGLKPSTLRTQVQRLVERVGGDMRRSPLPAARRRAS